MCAGRSNWTPRGFCVSGKLQVKRTRAPHGSAVWRLKYFCLFSLAFVEGKVSNPPSSLWSWWAVYFVVSKPKFSDAALATRQGRDQPV